MSKEKKLLQCIASYCDTLKPNTEPGKEFFISIPLNDYNHLKVIRDSIYEAIEALVLQQERTETHTNNDINYAIYWMQYLLKHTELISEYEGLSAIMVSRD